MPDGLGPRWRFGVPAAALLAALAIHGGDWNQALFLFLNGACSWLGDTFWACVTLFGDGLVIVALLALPLRRRPPLAWACALALTLVAAWIRCFKLMGPTRRPPAVLPLETFRVIGPVLRLGSFPSGHTAAIFALAAVCVVYAPNARWRLIAVGGAGLVGLSRIAVGVHWPLDVLVGAAGGWLAGVLGVAWARRWQYGLRPHGLVLPVVVLACALALFFADPKHEAARVLAYVIGTVTAGIATAELWRRLEARYGAAKGKSLRPQSLRR